MRKILILISILSLNFIVAQNTNSKINEFTKLYTIVKFYYPDTALKSFNWTAFVNYNIQNIIEDSTFNYINEINTIAPLTFTHKSKQNSILNKKEIVGTYYWQHLNGFTNKTFKSPFAISDIMGGFCYNDYDIRINIRLNKYAIDSNLIKFKTLGFSNDSIEIKVCNRDTMLNCKTIISYKNNDFYTFKIPETLLNKNKTNIRYTFKILRPKTGEIDIQYITVKSKNKPDTVLNSKNLKNYNISKYFYFPKLKLISIKIDSTKGKYLKLPAYDSIELYKQTDFSKYLVYELNSGKTFFSPRFINKKESSLTLEKKKYPTTSSNKIMYISDFVNLYSYTQSTIKYQNIKKDINEDELFNYCLNKIFTEDYNMYDHYLNLIYFMSAYKDPHLGVYKKKSLHTPIKIIKFSNRYIIDQVYLGNNKNLEGKEVVKINNLKVEQFLLQHIYPSSINSDFLINKYLKLILSPIIKSKKYNYTIKLKNGKVIKLDSMSFSNYPYYRVLLEDTAFTFFKNQASFYGCHMNSTYKDSTEHLDSLYSKNYIIIDFRNGQNNRYIRNLLYDKLFNNKVNTNYDRLVYIENPFNTKTMKDKISFIKNIYTNKGKNSNNTNKHLYVLVNGNTISFKEKILLPLYENNLITLIGDKTAGTAGAIFEIKLQSGFKIRYTAGYSTWSDGTPYQNTGMEPHYYIKPKYLKDVRLKTDRAFLKAKQLISRQIKIDKKNARKNKPKTLR